MTYFKFEALESQTLSQIRYVPSSYANIFHDEQDKRSVLCPISRKLRSSVEKNKRQ